MKTKLWRRVQGISKSGKYLTFKWKYERECEAEKAQEWLALFERDEPGAVFKLSEEKPRSSKAVRVSI